MPQFHEQRSVSTRAVILSPEEFRQALLAIGIEVPEGAKLLVNGYDPDGKIHGVTMPLGQLHLAVSWVGGEIPEAEAQTALRQAVYANEISARRHDQPIQQAGDPG